MADQTGFLSSGYHVLPPQNGSSGTITVTCGPIKAINPISAMTPYPNYPSYSGWNWTGGHSSVSFSVYPVTPIVGGTTCTSTGLQVLTGQQVSTTMSIDSSFSIDTTTYAWSAAGDTFETYDTSAPNTTHPTQLVPLSTADTTASTFSFYDKSKENIFINGTATVACPDGKTRLPVTVQSPLIAVQKPTVTATGWKITTGNVHHSTANSTSTASAFGLYPASGSDAPDGAYWYNVIVTVPQPFSGGTCCFTQLVQPNHQYNGVGKGTNNNVQGLDNSFEYFNYTWAPGANGTEGDSPALLIGDGKTIGDVATVNDAFNTWIMYQPTGGVWVPLQTYSYSWSLTLTWVAPGTWFMSGQNPPPPNSGPSYTATDTNIPPKWGIVQTNYSSQ